MNQHQYLLKTDRIYREQVTTETLLRMAQLVEALALRNGLSWDDEGNIEGLTKEEEKILLSKIPAVEMNTVRETRPTHRAIEQSVAVTDVYAATPDPDASFGSEVVEPGNPNQGSYLVDKLGIEDDTPVTPESQEDEEQAGTSESVDEDADEADGDDEEEATDEPKPRRRRRSASKA